MCGQILLAVVMGWLLLVLVADNDNGRTADE